MAGKRCVIEGYGSIGARHAGLLQELGQEVACVSRRNDVPFPVFRTPTEALAEFHPDLYLITTPTAEHLHSLRRLEKLGYTGTVLLEKPLGNTLAECGEAPSFPVYIAYNMRFHPLVERMKAALGDEPVMAARLSVGQYLPDWRPGRDYSKTYSAIRAQGGGVLRDLSHELDLVRFFLGRCRKITARLGTWSNLRIDTEDCVDMLLITEHCPAVNVHLDYLDRNPHRHMVLHTPTRTLTADLWHGALTINGDTENFTVERNDSFRKQLRKLLENDVTDMCTWSEGMETMRVMNAAEKAAQALTWEELS